MAEIRNANTRANEIFPPSFCFPMLMVLAQPDLGTALTYLPVAIMGLFLGGLRWKQALIVLMIMGLLVPVAWMKLLKPFVTPQQVGQHLLLVRRLSPRLEFKCAARGAHFGARDHEQLHVGARGDDGADIAAVEHGARRFCGEFTLIVHQRLPYLGDGSNHRRGFGDGL